jgi:hypothetical protein
MHSISLNFSFCQNETAVSFDQNENTATFTENSKLFQRLNFFHSFIEDSLRAQNALCCKTGGEIFGLLVSKQDGMVFSSSPTLLSLVRVNLPIPTHF